MLPAQIRHGGAHSLFLCNKTQVPLTVEVRGFSRAAAVTPAFDGTVMEGTKGFLTVTLSKWDVRTLRIQ